MAKTYEPIATTTLSSSAATIDFTSIPSTYTDLRMVISGVSNSSDNIFYRFNGVTGASYSRTDLSGSGSSAISSRASNQNYGRLTNYGYPTSTVGEHVTTWDIMNYSNSTTYKTSLSRSNRATNGVDAIVNLFMSTSAITSISLATNTFSGSSNWQSGATATLYGIKAA
jgi:hypothetical protein